MIRTLKTKASQVEAKTYNAFDPKTSAGVYVSVTPMAPSVAQIMIWAESLGLPLSAKERAELHCTVIYSKVIPPKLRPLDPEARYLAQVVGIEWWDGHDNEGYIVLKMNSPSLKELNRVWTEDGCVNTFTPYQPHVTIKKDVGPMPPNFMRLRAQMYRPMGTTLEFSNARLEGLKAKD